jgi:hypothetical protein
MFIQTISLIVCAVISAGGWIQPGNIDVIKSSISEIRASPSEYDGKIVRVHAWVRSSPYGISLQTDDFTGRIRLKRCDSEGVELPSQVTVKKDSLYDEFWKYVNDNDIPDSGPHGVRVELDGYVRLLKINGKPAEEFQLYGQWPLEIIYVQIGKMEIIP